MFVAVVAQDATARIYVNTVDVTTDASVTTVLPNDLPLHVGIRHGATDSAFIGALDDVRIFHVALTTAQITTLYNA